MKTVILCNQLCHLKGLLEDVSDPVAYISLLETRESFHIRHYLRQMPNTEELSKGALFRERSGRFRKEYIEFMGRLNTANHSPAWWAMPFTNKNPLASDLCRTTVHFLLLVELLRSRPGTLVVITDRTDLAAQVAAWGKVEDVRAINAIKGRQARKETIKKLTPVAILFAFFKSLYIWVDARNLRSSSTGGLGYTTLASVVESQSLAQPGEYIDAYFGKLVEYLVETGNRPMVLGLLQKRWRWQIARLKSRTIGVPVVPVEAYLTLSDLMKCTLRALTAWFSPARIVGEVEISGLELRPLVTRAVREARRSGNYFAAWRVYYAAARLARGISIGRLFYPYENRSWEKMLLLGIRQASPKTRIVGYQHASVTLSHTNFILSGDEAKVIPLPDAIVTTGPVVKEWLEGKGNYPKGLLRSGCALRQSQGHQPLPKKRRQPMNRVLIALATSIEEYVNTLMFLERSCAGRSGYNLRIRPHPTIALASSLKITPLSNHDFFSQSGGSLTEDLQWGDVVLYASSTVGMEAVSLGIPAVYLDLGEFLDTDPMFGWDEFKWTAREPSELVPILQKIESISQNQFQQLQKKGQQYAAAYLSPVTNKDLAAFLDA